MSTKLSFKQSFSILGGAISTLFNNPLLFFPFTILAFIQLLFMEILFFASRPPLLNIFRPIIVRLKGELYLHYPFNLDLMNHWFQSVQVIIFLFLTSMIIGKVVLMVSRINSDDSSDCSVPKLGLKRYVNLVISFFLVFLLMYGMTSVYSLLIHRASQIQSTNGIYFILKQAVLIGAPYFNLLFSIIVTTLLAYLVPLIVLDNKNVFVALFVNFKILWTTAVPMFIVIFISSLFYVPILLVKSNHQWFSSFMTPETWQIFIIFGIFVMLFIDAVQYTAITMCYLLTKDE